MGGFLARGFLKANLAALVTVPIGAGSAVAVLMGAIFMGQTVPPLKGVALLPSIGDPAVLNYAGQELLAPIDQTSLAKVFSPAPAREEAGCSVLKACSPSPSLNKPSIPILGRDNNNFGDAEPITGLPYHSAASNARADSEPEEPSECGARNTLWYRYPSPLPELLAMSAKGDGFAVVLAAYVDQGAGLGGLRQISCLNTGSQDSGGIEFGVEAGRTYYFQVGSLSSLELSQSKGNVEFRLFRSVRPGNDDFANALAVASNTEYAGDTTSATLETGEPRDCGMKENLYLSYTVWFRYRLPSGSPSKTITIDVTDSFAHARVEVYTGHWGDLKPQTEVCAQTVADQQAVTFTAQSGVDYQIQLGSRGGDIPGGRFTFVIR